MIQSGFLFTLRLIQSTSIQTENAMATIESETLYLIARIIRIRLHTTKITLIVNEIRSVMADVGVYNLRSLIFAKIQPVSLKLIR